MEYWCRLKELLKSQKITQEKLCKSCGISIATFVSWIHNERLPDLNSAVKIAAFLNTSVEYLVTGEDRNPLAAENAALKEKIQKVLEVLK